MYIFSTLLDLPIVLLWLFQAAKKLTQDLEYQQDFHVRFFAVVDLKMTSTLGNENLDLTSALVFIPALNTTQRLANYKMGSII